MAGGKGKQGDEGGCPACGRPRSVARTVSRPSVRGSDNPGKSHKVVGHRKFETCPCGYVWSADPQLKLHQAPVTAPSSEGGAEEEGAQ